MSIVLFIFILYILIILFSWLQHQAKKTPVLNQKKESINSTSMNQDKMTLPEHTIKNANKTEKNEAIIIDDEVKEFYQEKEKKNLTKKPVVMAKEEVIFGEEIELSEYLSKHILVNGIILSEIIAPPRALKPYNFRRYKRLR